MALPLPRSDFAERSQRYAGSYPEDEQLFAWLRREVHEEVLEAEMPIIDPHHHLWDLRPVDSEREMSAHLSVKRWYDSQKVYTLPEILEDVYDGHKIVATVFVQAGAFYWSSGPPHLRQVGEVEVGQGTAALCDTGCYGPTRVCAGIVGACDLADPNLEETLQAMMKSRSFRGVRATVTDLEMARPGLLLLEKFGLSLDRWSHNLEALPAFTKIAKAFPNITMILDHLGVAVGPGMGGAEAEAKWRAEIAELASSCPNVVCKVGGTFMLLNGFDLHLRETPIGSIELAELALPWYGHVIDCFGPSRCMFESNFPVDKGQVSYRVLWNMFKRVAEKKGLTAEQKKDIFHDTAARVYKLDIPQSLL